MDLNIVTFNRQQYHCERIWNADVLLLDYTYTEQNFHSICLIRKLRIYLGCYIFSNWFHRLERCARQDILCILIISVWLIECTLLTLYRELSEQNNNNNNNINRTEQYRIYFQTCTKYIITNYMTYIYI